VENPVKNPAPQQTPKSRREKQTRVVAIIVFAGLAFIIFLIMLGSHSSGGSQYSASTTGSTVIDPATLSVSFKVTNNGSSSADPTCTIQAQNANDSYSGIDQFQLQGSIAPGQTTTSADSITITNQGAQYVTQTTIKCS